MLPQNGQIHSFSCTVPKRVIRLRRLGKDVGRGQVGKPLQFGDYQSRKTYIVFHVLFVMCEHTFFKELFVVHIIYTLHRVPTN